MRTLIAIMVLFVCFSCYLPGRHPNISAEANDIVVLRPIEATVRESQNGVSNVHQIAIYPKGENRSLFQQAQFVNQQIGWASTDKHLYRTSNGGEAWEQLPFGTDNQSQISSFAFVNDSRGWAVVISQRPTERYGLGNSSQILSTTDGGNTWKLQADFPSEVKVKEIEFLDMNHGLAVGARVVDQPREQGPPYEEILVLRTSDGGSTWIDESAAVRNELKRKGNTLSDYGWSIHWSSVTRAFILTRNGRIIETSNGGTTWTTAARLQDERPNGLATSSNFQKLVISEDQRLRLIAGSRGDEGYWGNLIAKESDGSWSNYELRRMPLFDAVVLSQDEIIACGEEIRSKDQGTAPAVVGTIFHSVDGGKSWTMIYRSSGSEAFVSLIHVKQREFYALSDAGTFVNFSVD